MVEIINQNVTGGISGRRSGNPDGGVFHNDYGAMTAKEYIQWLIKRREAGKLNLGFAHYYIDRFTIARLEETYNGAYHTANRNGNMNYLGYEIIQSYYGVLTNEEFMQNEDMVFRQAAEDFHYYGLTPNKQTVRLHSEFSSTSCPHRSWDIHGKSKASVQAYFIKRIKHFMALGKTVQSIIEAEKGKQSIKEPAKEVAANNDNPFNVKVGNTVILNQTRALYWSNGKAFSKNDFHKYWKVKSISGNTANIYSTRDESNGGWAVLHDLEPIELDNPNNIVLSDTVTLNGRAKYWANKGARAKKGFTAADNKKTWKIKSIQTDSTANIYNANDPKDGGWAVLHDLSYK